MQMRAIIAMTTLIVVLSGCVTPEDTTDLQDWKGVACIGGLDEISSIHITNLLLSHDIKSAIDGSILYRIAVPAAKTEQASELLRADALNHGYYVLFDTNDFVRAAELEQRISRSAVSSVLERSEYASQTALGRFLRSNEISKLTAKYPYIVSLSVHERQYLATPMTFNTGYDVEIELQKSLREHDDGYRGWYQVYDSGKQVSLHGATEWKHAVE
jgi:hypothetical protein